jgi:hypothetical protein
MTWLLRANTHESKALKILLRFYSCSPDYDDDDSRLIIKGYDELFSPPRFFSAAAAAAAGTLYSNGPAA